MSTLYFSHTGPLLQYDHEAGFLRINDLNPEIETKWRFGRWELFVLGLKCIWASVLS